VAAREEGITSLIIQHGVIDFQYIPFNADYYCAWSAADKAIILEYDKNNDKIKIMGSPYMNRFRKSIHNFNDCKLNATNNKMQCLILSHTHVDYIYPDVFEEYKKILTNLDYDLFDWSVKLHPAETGIFYKNYKINVLPKDISLITALGQADVVFTLWSTSAYEAMIMNKPVIVMDFHNSIREYAKWPEKGGGIYLSTLRTGMIDLMNRQFIKNVLHNQETFTRNFIISEKQPEVEIAKFINELVKAKR